MKKNILISFLLAATTTISSLEIEFSKKAKTEMLVPQKQLKEESSFNSKKYINKEAKFEEKLFKLKNNFSQTSTQDKSNIFFKSGKKLKGKARSYSTSTSEYAATNFLDTYFPDVLGTDEELKVMYIKEDYGADQTRLDNGEISPEVDLRTYSYTIKVGRTIKGKPIFNSFATIEVDATNDDIISFDMEKKSKI